MPQGVGAYFLKKKNHIEIKGEFEIHRQWQTNCGSLSFYTELENQENTGSCPPAVTAACGQMGWGVWKEGPNNWLHSASQISLKHSNDRSAKTGNGTILPSKHNTSCCQNSFLLHANGPLLTYVTVPWYKSYMNLKWENYWNSLLKRFPTVMTTRY